MGEIIQRLVHELEHHIPFTIFGASTGIFIMIIILYGNITLVYILKKNLYLLIITFFIIPNLEINIPLTHSPDSVHMKKIRITVP